MKSPRRSRKKQPEWEVIGDTIAVFGSPRERAKLGRSTGVSRTIRTAAREPFEQCGWRFVKNAKKAKKPKLARHVYLSEHGHLLIGTHCVLVKLKPLLNR